MKTNILDYILAAWIMLMGLFFVGSMAVELQVVARSVYVIMLGFCAVKVALSITRAVARKTSNEQSKSGSS